VTFPDLLGAVAELLARYEAQPGEGGEWPVACTLATARREYVWDGAKFIEESEEIMDSEGTE
jgi:hypothetical protein